jgi:nickel transport protein
MMRHALHRISAALLAGLVLGLCGPCCSPAHAHRVTVFAWVNGDTVEVESGFSRGNPVIEGKITVADAVTGEQLLHGITDARGRFSFPMPDQVKGSGHGLLVRVDAGEGHRNQWLLAADDLPGASQAAKRPPEDGLGAASPPPATSAPHGVSSPAGGVASEDLRNMLASVLDEKLAPLRRSLTILEQPEPGLRDVIGGIGWIVGLAGIFLYLRRRGR